MNENVFGTMAQFNVQLTGDEIVKAQFQSLGDSGVRAAKRVMAEWNKLKDVNFGKGITETLNMANRHREAQGRSAIDYVKDAASRAENTRALKALSADVIAMGRSLRAGNITQTSRQLREALSPNQSLRNKLHEMELANFKKTNDTKFDMLTKTNQHQAQFLRESSKINAENIVLSEKANTQKAKTNLQNTKIDGQIIKNKKEEVKLQNERIRHERNQDRQLRALRNAEHLSPTFGGIYGVTLVVGAAMLPSVMYGNTERQAVIALKNMDRETIYGLQGLQQGEDFTRASVRKGYQSLIGGYIKNQGRLGNSVFSPAQVATHFGTFANAGINIKTNKDGTINQESLQGFYDIEDQLAIVKSSFEGVSDEDALKYVTKLQHMLPKEFKAFGNEMKKKNPEVTDLQIQAAFLTQYTSFLAQKLKANPIQNKDILKTLINVAPIANSSGISAAAMVSETTNMVAKGHAPNKASTIASKRLQGYYQVAIQPTKKGGFTDMEDRALLDDIYNAKKSYLGLTGNPGVEAFVRDKIKANEFAGQGGTRAQFDIEYRNEAIKTLMEQQGMSEQVASELFDLYQKRDLHLLHQNSKPITKLQAEQLRMASARGRSGEQKGISADDIKDTPMASVSLDHLLYNNGDMPGIDKEVQEKIRERLDKHKQTLQENLVNETKLSLLTQDAAWEKTKIAAITTSTIMGAVFSPAIVSALDGISTALVGNNLEKVLATMKHNAENPNKKMDLDLGGIAGMIEGSPLLQAALKTIGLMAGALIAGGILYLTRGMAAKFTNTSVGRYFQKSGYQRGRIARGVNSVGSWADKGIRSVAKGANFLDPSDPSGIYDKIKQEGIKRRASMEAIKELKKNKLDRITSLPKSDLDGRAALQAQRNERAKEIKTQRAQLRQSSGNIMLLKESKGYKRYKKQRMISHGYQKVKGFGRAIAGPGTMMALGTTVLMLGDVIHESATKMQKSQNGLTSSVGNGLANMKLGEDIKTQAAIMMLTMGPLPLQLLAAGYLAQRFFKGMLYGKDAAKVEEPAWKTLMDSAAIGMVLYGWAINPVVSAAAAAYLGIKFTKRNSPVSNAIDEFLYPTEGPEADYHRERHKKERERMAIDVYKDKGIMIPAHPDYKAWRAKRDATITGIESGSYNPNNNNKPTLFNPIPDMQPKQNNASQGGQITIVAQNIQSVSTTIPNTTIEKKNGMNFNQQYPTLAL